MLDKSQMYYDDIIVNAMYCKCILYYDGR